MRYNQNPYTDILHKSPHQECVRCVMDTSDPEISFDAEGICNYCHYYDSLVSEMGSTEERQIKLADIVSQLKTKNRDKDYDCIIGLSGGVDSSYLAWFATTQLKLRPLVVHVDAGWNSELAVNNVQNIVQVLGLDMHTIVVDWREMQDLQRAYFLSGVANLDVPQDHAFDAGLNSVAKKYGIRTIFSGGNIQTESILPSAWGYDASDLVSLKAIHKKYGTTKLKNYPTLGFWQRRFIDRYIFGVETIRVLEFIDYSKDAAKKLLKRELNWRDYGGKHYESVFTKFFQAYYLPSKFGYDKRLAHLSSLIVSGQITRDEAKKELREPLYDAAELEHDKRYWTKKLGIEQELFAQIMEERPKRFDEYPNSLRRSQFILSTGARFKQFLKRD